MTLVGVLYVGNIHSQAAFTGKITNVDAAGTAFRSCINAEEMDQATIYYALTNVGKNSETNLGTSAPANNGSYRGNNGGLANANKGTTAPTSCRRDTQTVYWNVAGNMWLSEPTAYALSGAEAVSQEIWFKTTNLYGYVMGFGDSQTGFNGSSARGRVVYIDTTGHLQFVVCTSTSNLAATGCSAISSTNAVNDGTWHHVVAVYNNGTEQIYVDGTLNSTGTAMAQSIGAAYWRLADDTLAGYPGATTNNKSYPFNTSGGNAGGPGMQWAALYTGIALTPNQVKDHYLAGTAP